MIWSREAEPRRIRMGDIVKAYNERGVVLCGAYVTERIVDRACYVDHGARNDPIIPGWLDRCGAINTISPLANTSATRPEWRRAAILSRWKR